MILKQSRKNPRAQIPPKGGLNSELADFKSIHKLIGHTAFDFFYVQWATVVRKDF